MNQHEANLFHPHPHSKSAREKLDMREVWLQEINNNPNEISEQQKVVRNAGNILGKTKSQEKIASSSKDLNIIQPTTQAPFSQQTFLMTWCQALYLVLGYSRGKGGSLPSRSSWGYPGAVRRHYRTRLTPWGQSTAWSFQETAPPRNCKKVQGGLWDSRIPGILIPAVLLGSLSREIVLFPGHLKTSSHHHASGSHAARWCRSPEAWSGCRHTAQNQSKDLVKSSPMRGASCHAACS